MSEMKSYSVESSDQKFVREYGFLCLAKNIGEVLSSKHKQKQFDQDKQYITDALNPLQKK